MQTLLVILPIMFAGFTGGDEPKRTLTIDFHFPSERVNHESAIRAAADPPKQFCIAGEPIRCSVYLHALSVEDRMQFEALVIDDWRYDTPTTLRTSIVPTSFCTSIDSKMAIGKRLGFVHLPKVAGQA